MCGARPPGPDRRKQSGGSAHGPAWNQTWRIEAKETAANRTPAIAHIEIISRFIISSYEPSRGVQVPLAPLTGCEYLYRYLLFIYNVYRIYINHFFARKPEQNGNIILRDGRTREQIPISNAAARDDPRFRLKAYSAAPGRAAGKRDDAIRMCAA